MALVLSIAGAAVTVSAAVGYAEHDEKKTVASFSEILSASDGFAGDGFGLAVDVDGDVMVVGAIGAAYVFTRVAGQWQETVKLTVPSSPSGRVVSRVDDGQARYVPVDGQDILLGRNGVVYGGFGRAVAVSGDVIVVGAYEAAYVFTSVDGDWRETAKLTGAEDLSGLRPLEDGSSITGRGSTVGLLDGGFGSSVAVDGDLLAVGANGVVRFPELSSGATPSGVGSSDSVYVFTRHENDWRETARLVRSGGPQLHDFGRDVVVDGNVLVVGSHSSAFVYERSGDEWAEPTELLPIDHNSSPGFGQSVAASGNSIAVSSRDAVHVFERSPGDWGGNILEPSFDPDYYRFGLDVDLDSNLAVMAPYKSVAGQGMNPIVFSLFDRPGADWRVTETSGYGSKAWRVQSVAIGGGVIALGAHLSTYEAGEDLVWRTTHEEPGVVHIHNLQVLEPAEEGVTPTETPLGLAAEEQPTTIAEPAPSPTAAEIPTAVPAGTVAITPAATPIPTAAVAAQPELVDDDSPGGGVNAVWAAVIIAPLALIILVIAYFVIRRKPSDDAGRYTT